MQRGSVAKVGESLAHLGEKQFRLVAQAEQSFGAAEFLAGAGDGENLVRGHGVRAGVSGIAAEGAVSAVIAAEIGQREEDLTRVSDDAGFEAFFGGASGGEKFGKLAVGAADEAQSGAP